MVLFLGEDDVKQVLTMPDAVRVLEEMFRQDGLGGTINNPRQRVRTHSAMLHLLAGALPYLGVMGYKAYTSSSEGAKFRVFLHDIETGRLLAVIDANYLGMMRTGATTGVATKYMARGDSSTVGIFGPGYQARGQLMGVAAVRDVKRVFVYGRNAERRKSFSREMEETLGVPVSPVENPREAVSGADCIVTSTTAFEPVLHGAWLEKGVHVNAIGGNFLFKREIDERAAMSARIIAVESREQSRMEAGELLPLVEKGKLQWRNLVELGEIVAGKAAGRISGEDITLFKSVGVAVEDLAVAEHAYRAALSAGLGRSLDMPAR
ncbi:MAG TPA: ornithine cyclodeaminase family protein [Thermodesulfobacteriota bacterium]|nr:ornithine cyclodeaminase family protein [Thermodesulfobacteriota bacterium]